MKSIKLKNDRLQTLLSSTIDLFYNDTVKQICKKCKDKTDNLIPDLDPCSEEYLMKAFTLELREYGYPRALRGMGLVDMQHFIPDSTSVKEISRSMSKIGRFLGTPNQALTMYYPEDGHIGWHHNGNAPGYNILITYSLDGDGGFSFWDYKTKSIQTIQDKIGWNVKVGYYPNIRKEPNRVYWHMAKTKNPRVSIAWVIDQKEMWKSMIDEITQGDYDHEDILSQ
jgi:hypothetical protein